MSNWQRKLGWLVLVVTPSTYLNDIIEGDYISLREACALLRQKGFLVSNRDPRVEISMSDKLSIMVNDETKFENTINDFNQWALTGTPIKKEGMRVFEKQLVNFFQKRVNPTSFIDYYYGSIRWLAVFRVYKKGRYILGSKNIEKNSLKLKKSDLSFEDYLNTDISDILYKDHKYNLPDKMVNIIVISPFEVEDNQDNIILLETD